MNTGSFKNHITYRLVICKLYTHDISMYKKDLAVNNPQGLICHRTQSAKQLTSKDVIF